MLKHVVIISEDKQQKGNLRFWNKESIRKAEIEILFGSREITEISEKQNEILHSKHKEFLWGEHSQDVFPSSVRASGHGIARIMKSFVQRLVKITNNL